MTSVRADVGSGSVMAAVLAVRPTCHRLSRVSITPLRFGAGVKGKISTEQSAGVPLVVTSTAV